MAADRIPLGAEMLDFFSKSANISINGALVFALTLVSQIDNELYRLIGTVAVAAIIAVYSYASLKANPPK